MFRVQFLAGFLHVDEAPSPLRRTRSFVPSNRISSPSSRRPYPSSAKKALPANPVVDTTETVRSEFIRPDEVRSFWVLTDVLADGLEVPAFPSLVRHRLYVGGSTDFALLDRPETK